MKLWQSQGHLARVSACINYQLYQTAVNYIEVQYTEQCSLKLTIELSCKNSIRNGTLYIASDTSILKILSLCHKLLISEDNHTS